MREIIGSYVYMLYYVQYTVSMATKSCITTEPEWPKHYVTDGRIDRETCQLKSYVESPRDISSEIWKIQYMQF